MKLRISLPIFLATLALAACSTNPERVALEAYLATGEQIANQMTEVGTKFETLMNVQGNILAWSDAEKQEIKTVSESLVQLESSVKAMNVPALLSTAHPLLIQSIEKMRAAVDGILKVAENPAMVTESMAAELESAATSAEALSTQYVQAMESALQTSYPDLLPKEGE